MPIYPSYNGQEELTARDLNRMLQEVRNALITRSTPPIFVKVDGSGCHFTWNGEDADLIDDTTSIPGTDVPSQVYGQILYRNVDGTYAWREMEPVMGTAEMIVKDKGIVGDTVKNPAYEEAGNWSVIPLTFAFFYQIAKGIWSFKCCRGPTVYFDAYDYGNGVDKAQVNQNPLVV